jgi:uncharacterized DUF497 family protein
MVPPPSPFRMVFRSFERFEYNEKKNAEVLEMRAFDLSYVTQMFPGHVLERRDTRVSSETRFQVIGEVFDEVFVLVYTMRQGACRVITAWEADWSERQLWYDYTR